MKVGLSQGVPDLIDPPLTNWLRIAALDLTASRTEEVYGLFVAAVCQSSLFPYLPGPSLWSFAAVFL